AGGFGPLVAPQTAIRPPARAACSDRCQVASPTCSSTTSTPAPPVASLTAARTSPSAWFTVASAPSSRARSSFSSLEEVTNAGPVRAEDPRLRHRRKPFADPDVEMVERRGAKRDQNLAGPGLRIGSVLIAEHLGPAVLVDPDRLHVGTISHMQAGELTKVAEELGLDVVGAAPVSAYEETERHIRERRERGLSADMRFTMARPEASCHPEP